jgi:hypothetical protein
MKIKPKNEIFSKILFKNSITAFDFQYRPLCVTIGSWDVLVYQKFIFESRALSRILKMGPTGNL